MKKSLNPAEVQERLKAWADITMLSLELKKAFLRKRYPELTETEISELIRKEHEIAEGFRIHHDGMELSGKERR
ncbi:MAG: hypothetical protein IBX72_07265 [Nitrospirae bacterium]|jgi:hypothetical protein|nr:hypothetical protein [Nitrospirota bacterium]